MGGRPRGVATAPLFYVALSAEIMTTKEKPAVLMVIDDNIGRCFTAKRLEPYFNITEAAAGAEGIRGSLAGPDIILLDVHLPDINGFEVCRRIKITPATAQIPVLLLSAGALDPASRAAGLENGADGFFAMPVESQVLISTINSLLRIKKAEAALAAGNKHLATVAEIDRIFLSTRGRETWKALLAAVLSWIPSAAGSFGYLNEAGDMVFGAVLGVDWAKCLVKDKNLNVPHADWKERPWARAITGGIIVVNNEPPCRKMPPGHFKVDRSLSMPLMDGGRAVGHITLANKARDYTPEDIAFAKLISGHTAALLKGRLDTEKQEERNRHMLLEMANMQKTEALGQLAAGIAHDFNNILAGMTGNLSVLNAQKGLGEESRAVIKDMLAAADNAREITRRLLTFAKGEQPVIKVFSFAKALASWCSFAMRGSISKAEVRIAPDLWAMDGDRGQLSQVVNNLLRNALEAMPQGGRVLVAAENIEHEPAPDLLLPGGKYIKLTVADNGIGIPGKYLNRLFEPYFTTKTQGHGLGLPMVYSIIKNHGGYVKVKSQPGSGTEFVIYLPAAPGEAPAVSGTSPAAQKGRGRVLVMDDEDIVQKAVNRMVTALGYKCVCVSDGKEALDLFKDSLGTPGAFKVVIMDLTVPGGMGGAEAVKKLLELDPSAKVVVSSGYGEDDAMAEYRAGGFSAALIKPYKFEDLAAVLAELIKA